MRILIVTPAAPGSRQGNRITAVRWASCLRKLGHSVRIALSFEGQRCDVLIALHARKSAASIRRFREGARQRPLIVALTGTDLYHDIYRSSAAAESLELASRLVVLQSAALEALPARLHAKSRVIYQSSVPVAHIRSVKRHFEVAVAGHLRQVKDPFRAAMATRNLPAESKIVIRHAGAALSPAMAQRARQEMSRNPRYQWLGDLAHWRTKRLIARAQVMVLSSKMEGGAIVISEAVVNRTPVIASRISGARGMLGNDYPGFFDYGDTAGLRQLLLQAENDRAFMKRLRQAGRERLELFRERREVNSWKQLLGEFTGQVAR